MVSLLSFLKAHWQTGLLVSLAALVMLTISLERAELRHANRELSRMHAENTTLEQSNDALVVSINQQNAALERLRKTALEKQARALAATKAANARNAGEQKRFEKQLSRSLPLDECSAMVTLLNEVALNEKSPRH